MDIRAIILCGGAGTRLRDELGPRTPKFLCPIDEADVLADLVLRYLLSQGCRSLIFATGYLHDEIAAFVTEKYRNAFDSIIFSRELMPLGTGGAVAHSLAHIPEDHVCVINGDTIHSDSLDQLYTHHLAIDSDITILTAIGKHLGDQGVLTIDKFSRVLSFDERSQAGVGAINAGVYLCRTSILHKIPKGNVSFERDFLPSLLQTQAKIFAFYGRGFHDVGTPLRLAEIRKKC
jgi:NDP-sugar pyrophosphorylase family protein